MNEYDVKRLALVLAIQAEIEAMKVENIIRERQGYSPAYDEPAFIEMAEKLRHVAYCHNEQL